MARWRCARSVIIASCCSLLAPGVVAAGEVLPLPVVGQSPATSNSLVPRVESPGSLSLSVVAQLDPAALASMAFGDTDHDGYNEVLFRYGIRYRIHEEIGNNLYSLVHSSESFFYPEQAGDLDGDGKSDVVGQESSYLQVYESPDAASHPVDLVWSSPALSNFVGHPTIADSDRDGRMEIIHSVNGSSGLIIVENTGDDSYDLVYVATTPGNSATGSKVVGDFDGDGLFEIALSGVGGWVHVFESSADNAWSLTWSDSTGLVNAYGCAGGVDTDGNGVPEIFVAGNTPIPGVGWDKWRTYVYEATSDNQFARVDTIVTDTYWIAATHNVIADLTGDGSADYVLDTYDALIVYASENRGEWTPAACIAEPPPYGYHGGVFAYDVNRNGISELFWRAEPGARTLVYESMTATSADRVRFDLAVIQAAPNPCRKEAAFLTVVPNPDVRWLSVFDVTGRLVNRAPVGRDASQRLVWQPAGVPSGVYLLRLEDARQRALATGRVTVAQ